MTETLPLRMRFVNALRITAHTKKESDMQKLITALKAYSKTACTIDVLTHETYDTLYTLKLWVTKQPEIRSLLRALLRIPEEDKNQLLKELPTRMDQRGNVYFKVGLDGFVTGRPRLEHTGDVIQIRMNMAAHPKTPENVQAIATQLLHKDVNL